MLEGSELEAARAGCPGAEWGAGGCDRNGILGGCRLVANSVNWYYTGPRFSTAAEVMQECTFAGATFVDPP